ncbi:hypothetical protein F5Y10DRAFT_292051 [Nemania abortiva]|nr:hypothetical protein F5Y10DRAFT_292051 [Nemania abortiva]
MASAPPALLNNGFQRALDAFVSRLKPSEKSLFKVTTLDELKVTILTIQADQRARKKMMHLNRILPFLETMDQLGKVIEVFLNTTNFLAFVWGPVKLLLLTATSWLESFDDLLDAYQLIAQNLPILEGYQSIFGRSPQIQSVLEGIWSNILEFHIRALRIFEQSMLQQFFRSLWKDFNSRFRSILNDLKGQKDLLESHATQIHIQRYEADRLKIFEEFEQVQAMRASQKKSFVVQWIAACNAIQDHESLCAIRREEHIATNSWPGLWIIYHGDVEAWLAKGIPKASILWITAIPGAGKTMLASVIINKIKNDGVGPNAFIYCKHRDLNKNTFVSVMKAFLSQLLSQQDHLIPFYYDEGIASGEVVLSSTKLCKKLLRYILQNIPEAFLILDGLDECEPDERKLILDFFKEVINLCDSARPGKVRMLILSRDEPDIKKSLSAATIVRITRQDNLQDIERYIQHRAASIQKKFAPLLSDEDREYIKQNVADRSEGMFLYAKLVIANLDGQVCFDDLRSEFHQLPSGLDEAYARNLGRISNLHVNSRKTVMKILSLMICCRRPLRWRELQAAISINIADCSVDVTRRSVVHVQEMCGSLVEVSPDGRIDFVHMTASLYITKLGFISYDLAEQSMAFLCMHYLAFECFENQIDDGKLYLFIKKGFFAFQDYAIAHWTDHLVSSLRSPESLSPSKPNDLQEALAAFLIFSDRYKEDLGTLSLDDASLPLNTLQSSFSDCVEEIALIWRHAKSFKAFVDDRRDKISIPSLKRSLERNRKALETLSSVANRAPVDMGDLNDFYGGNWFKCHKLSCFYFHEGFPSQLTCKAHLNRHDRPFSCLEEDCPAAKIGFSSLKEMEKHKRNMHPGINKLSSTFARFKNGKGGHGAIQKYPCPRCPLGFESRVECRIHMRVHNRRIMLKVDSKI